MDKQFIEKIEQCLNNLTDNKYNKKILLEYFEGKETLEENNNFYDYDISFPEESNHKFVNDFLDEINGTSYEKKVYQILFYANECLFYECLKDRFTNKENYYYSMKNLYDIDLKFIVSSSLDLRLRKNKLNYLEKNILWDIIELENIIDKLENKNSKLVAIAYLIASQKEIGYKLFQEIFPEFLKKIITSNNNELNSETIKLYKYVIGEENLTTNEIYSFVRRNAIEHCFNIPMAYFNIIMRNIVVVTYDKLEEIQRLVKILIINDYIHHTDFFPFNIYLENLKPIEVISFYVNYYRELKLHDVYIIDRFLKSDLIDVTTDWLLEYIKSYLKNIDNHDYILTDIGSKIINKSFGKLRNNEKDRLNSLYRKITGKDYKNYSIEEFKIEYKQYLKKEFNIDDLEIDNVFNYFDNKIEIDNLKEQTTKNTYTWNQSSVEDRILVNLENNQLEYYIRFIIYEKEKLGKSILRILILEQLNISIEHLEKYNFTKKELDEIAFDYYCSYNSQLKNIGFKYLKELDKKTFFNLMKNLFKNLNVDKKSIFFNSFIDDIDIFEIYFDNLGSSKLLKKLWIDKIDNFDKKSIINILKNKLNEKSNKHRENSVDILIELNIEKINEILKEHLSKEKSKKIIDKIEIFLNKSIENNSLESYLKLLKTGNKTKLKNLSSFLIALKDKNNNELPIEYSMTIISFYMNYEIEKAKEFTNSMKEFINEDSIIKLANNTYSWFKSTDFDNKYKEIGYFSIINSDFSVIENIKQDIIALSKTARGSMATNMIKTLAFNNEKSILTFLDYATRKIRHKQIKKGAKEALVLAAKSRNLSLEELQDKIIPDFDLDIRGEKIYDYGKRAFKVILLPKGQFEIIDIEKNKILKNLPKTGKNDDEEIANKLQEEFKILKKQIKNNYKIQLERMENILLTGRTWTKESFINIFLNNPIMREFSISLIWGIYDEKNNVLKTFRGLEDKTLITHNDEEIDLDNNKIGLIHPIEINKEIIDAWKENLEDYEVVQPFSQLNRKTFTDKKDYKNMKAKDSEINNKLLKLGWERGDVLDGGGFYQFYYKNEVNNIGVELKHEGIAVGWYENKEIEIEELSFYKLDKEKFDLNGILEEEKFEFDEIPKRFYSEIILQLDNLIN